MTWLYPSARPSRSNLWGCGVKQLDQAADLAVQNPYYNPRPVTRSGVRQLLENAFQGRLN